MHTDVRLPRACSDVPVDLADVVARDVRPHLRELRALAEHRRAIVAGKQAADPAADAHLERSQQDVGQRARARTLGRRLGPERAERHHATFGLARSVAGTGTCARTRSRIASGDISSASAWYVSTSRWRIASFISVCRSSARTYSRPRMRASARAACTRLIGPRGLAPNAMYSFSSSPGARVAVARSTA